MEVRTYRDCNRLSLTLVTSTLRAMTRQIGDETARSLKQDISGQYGVLSSSIFSCSAEVDATERQM
jgi:hypothetical protein